MSHVDYVAKVRKLIKLHDQDAKEDTGTELHTRLTGNAYYHHEFGNVWLEAEVKFTDKSPSFWCWFCIIDHPNNWMEKYQGLSVSQDHDLKYLQEGWYAPVGYGA